MAKNIKKYKNRLKQEYLCDNIKMIYLEVAKLDIEETKELLEKKAEDMENIQTETQNINDKKEKEKKKRTGSTKTVELTGNKNKKIFILMGIVLFVVLAILTIIAVINKLNNNVYSNVYFENIDISGKTITEVDNIIQNYAKEAYNRSVVVFQDENMLMEVDAEDIGIVINTSKTQEEILKFGRTGNIIKDNIDVVKAKFFGKEFHIQYEYSQSKIAVLVDKILALVEGKVVDDKYEVVENNLVITKGMSGLDIDKDELIEDLTEIIVGRDNSNKVQSYILKTYTREPKAIDVDVVYASVYKEAKDAKIDESKNPVEFISHEKGISFDKEALRVELLKEENNVEGAEIRFALDIIEPKVKLSDLRWELYEDLLGTYTTSFATSYGYENRSSNIRVTANYLDGVIIMPGETFSFNKVVGDCGSAARGFKMATIYSGGKVEQGMGGGVCQVSSTLYNAVIYANLEIVARDNHGYTVGYVACGRDATIYYPYTDFKFKNNRNYPVKIVTSYNSSGKITTSIYGTKEDNEYEVEIQSYILTTIPKGTTYVNDNTLDKGTTKLDSSGQTGYTSIAYKVLKQNGKVVSKTVLSNDTYKAMNAIVRVGTKPVVVDPYAE